MAGNLVVEGRNYQEHDANTEEGKCKNLRSPTDRIHLNEQLLKCSLERKAK
ncbi:hypothetical protein ABIE49_006122 [Bradyrhizobium sp. OAE829]